MTVIAIANGAGSAGKTTTATALAALAAADGQRVRLIDLDPQGNATRWVGAADPAATIADVLTAGTPIADVEVAAAVEGLTVVPAHPDQMAGIEPTLSRTIGAEQRLRIAIEAAPAVDLTVIDCPGSLGLLTLTGLVAAETVITVVLPTLKELAGLPRIDELVTQVRSAYRPKLELAGIVPCMVPAGNAGHLYQDAMDLVREQWGDKVTPEIRRTVKVPQSYAAAQPLPVYDPAGNATDDYRAVLAWLDARGLI